MTDKLEALAADLENIRRELDRLQEFSRSQRPLPKRRQPKNLACSFCSIPREKLPGTTLIVGHGNASICAECIGLCVEIIVEQNSKEIVLPRRRAKKKRS